MKYFILVAASILLVGCMSAVQKSYMDGSDAYLAGNYDLAKTSLQKCAASLFPQCNYILGNIALKEGKINEAMFFLERDAVKGHKESQAFLAFAIYKAYKEEGISDDKKAKEVDLSDAIAWIWVARKQGFNDSSNLFSTLTFELSEKLKVKPSLVPGSMLAKLNNFEEKYLPRP